MSRGLGAVVALCAATSWVCPTATSAQDTHLLVIGGAGGEAEYRERFHGLALQLIDAVLAAGLSSESVTYLAERPQRDPRIDGESRRERIEAELERLAGVIDADDQLFVVLIGHGSSRQEEARFNLPGPDLSAAEFDTLLDGVRAGQLVFVNTSSASGGFVPALAGPGRIVMTATRSGSERNLTRFPEHFVAAYTNGGTDADVDKNGRVSVLEAFEYARQETARSYQRDNQIATEHPLLDDDGDGEGSGEITAESADGRLARAVYLTPAQAVLTEDVDDPELRRLLEERAELEARVQALRDLRDSMDPDVYQRELEALLLELALKNREIREKGGGGSDAP